MFRLFYFFLLYLLTCYIKMENKKCEFCGKDIGKHNSKTCSRICSDELKKMKNREERECVFCSKKFLVKKSSSNKLCSDDCRKKWGVLPENKEKRIEASKKAVKDKFGVDSFFKLDISREKIKKTKLEKYGDENYNNLEKNRQTKKERYGDENYNNLEKNRQTKKEKYGDENYNNREKAINTSIDRHGVDFVLKLDLFKEKQKNTLYENFGVYYPIQSEEIKNKIKKTNLEKYGFEFPSMNSEIIKKIKKSLFIPFNQTVLYDKITQNDIVLKSEYSGISNYGKYEPYFFECLKCGNNFQETFANHRSPVCRVCNPTYKNNSHQILLRDFFLELNLFFYENHRNLISPFEVDFYFPEQNLAVEINGNYFHSEIGGNKLDSYHLNKTNLCQGKNVKLIHIFEDEILNKKEIVFSILKNTLNKIERKIYAEKCVLKEISYEEKNDFIEQNHIQGKCEGRICFGLYFMEELVSVISFNKINNNDNEFELIRFVNKNDINVVGSFSKLLNHFITTNSPKKIISYGDIRWNGLEYENTVYYKNKFKFLENTKPNYWYFKNGNYLKRHHRSNLIKDVLIKECIEKNISFENDTEWDLAKKLSMDRIWDCGSMKFEIEF